MMNIIDQGTISMDFDIDIDVSDMENFSVFDLQKQLYHSRQNFLFDADQAITQSINMAKKSVLGLKVKWQVENKEITEEQAEKRLSMPIDDLMKLYLREEKEAAE